MWSEEWQKDANVLLFWICVVSCGSRTVLLFSIITMNNVERCQPRKFYLYNLYLKLNNDIVSQIYICWSVELSCIFHHYVWERTKSDCEIFVWIRYNDLWFSLRHLFGFIVKFISIQWLNQQFEMIEVSDQHTTDILTAACVRGSY